MVGAETIEVTGEGLTNYPATLGTMTDTELETAVRSQILANEESYKALAEKTTSYLGPSVMVLMPSEKYPRWLQTGTLTSVVDEASAAADALSLMESVEAGEQVVIAQGASFQMVAFTYAWTV